MPRPAKPRRTQVAASARGSASVVQARHDHTGMGKGWIVAVSMTRRRLGAAIASAASAKSAPRLSYWRDRSRPRTWSPECPTESRW